MDDLFEKLKPMQDFDAPLDIEEFAMPQAEIPPRANPTTPTLEQLVDLNQQNHLQLADVKGELAELKRAMARQNKYTALRDVLCVLLGALLGFALMYGATIWNWF